MFPPSGPTSWPPGPPAKSSSTLGDSSHAPRVPVRTVGPYQLLTQLGNTSQGPVFAARIPGNEAQFALKVFQRQLPPEEVARVRQEIQAVSRLEHPGIVRPVDVGLEQGRLYVVYEHVPGMTLQEQLSKSGPLPSDQAARMVADLAEALHAAHEVGVVHRDLHPGCVVIDSRSGRARVGDFGHPQDPAAAGSQARPTYQAPEQLEGGPVDRATDVYGLGAVLYELLTCMPPFSGLSHDELRQRILAGKPDAPRDLVASVDGAVEKVCLRALALAPRKRYPTADALAGALRRAADRHAGRASAGLLVALALGWIVSTGLIAGWGWSERDERLGLSDRLQQAEQDLSTAQNQAAAVGSDLLRSKSELSAAQDAHRREVEQVRRELNQARSQLQQAAQGMQSASHGGGRGLIPEQGEVGRAIEAVTKALEALPGSERLRLRLSLARRDLPAALELLERLRAAAPEDEELLTCAVTCALSSGQAGRAEALREELERRAEPGSPGALFARIVTLNGKPTTAEQLQELIEQLRAKSQSAPWLRVPLANLLSGLIQSGAQQPQLLSEGVRLTEEALKLDPLDSEARQLRARLLVMGLSLGLQRNNPEPLLRRALADMQLLRELTGQPSLWVEIGKLFVMSSDFAQAREELEEGKRYADQLRSPVEMIQARVWLGNALALQRDEQRALASWAEALQLAQKQPNLGTLLLDTINGLPAVSQGGQQQFLQSLPPQVRDQLIQLASRMRQQQQQQRPR